MKENKIKSYWDSQAQLENVTEDLVTIRDPFQRQLEIETILEFLPTKARVLDIGCGNGYSTALFAQTAEHVLGIDYSEDMIARAEQNYGAIQNVEFKVQDVLALDLPGAEFDVAISQRCLINLPTWEKQQAAIKNIADMLKPGGVLLLQEGTRQGREQLNQARQQVGLSRMPEVAYNLDFDEETLWPFVRQYFKIVAVKRYGLYDLIARIVHPLFVHPEEPQYKSKINQIAQQITSELDGMDELSREFTAYLRKLG